MEEEYYIINRMYAGEYLQGDNIGHEVINLFTDDSGNNYIYINQAGTIANKYDNKVKAVLLTRMADSIHRQEILGVALLDKDSQISHSLPQYHGAEKIEREQKIIEDYLSVNNIQYGGVNIRKVFGYNKWNGNYDQNCTITFKAKKVIIPKEKIYIIDKDYKGPKERFALKDNTFPKISPKCYIGNIDKEHSFDTITELLNDESLWDYEKNPEKIIIDNKKVYFEDSHNYLDIIGRQDDENVISNLIDYFLSYDSELLQSFCREVLNIQNFSLNGYCEREKNADGARIDLYIEDENNIIVIENKIKAEINGINERHNFNGKLIQSQLSKYYNYVNSNIGGKTAHYFILMPNYRKIDISQYKNSKNYKKITYKQIYEFFKAHKPDNENILGYYKDFVKALRRHTEDYYDDQYAEMKKRFIRRIEKIRKQLK